MLEYVPILHVLCYAQNYAGIIRQGLICEFMYTCATKASC